jgi:hypothetical protein
MDTPLGEIRLAPPGSAATNIRAATSNATLAINDPPRRMAATGIA